MAEIGGDGEVRKTRIEEPRADEKELRAQPASKRKHFKPIDIHVEACLICDGEGKLMKCYTCPRAYHAKCLDPPPSSIDKRWQCQYCAADISEAEAFLLETSSDRKADCLNLVQVLSDHDFSGPFLSPVDLELAPGYDLFVAKPLSLSEIRSKYAKITKVPFPIVDFLLDMRRVMLNCRSYNAEGSLIWDECKLLTDIIEENIKQRLSQHFQDDEGEQLVQQTSKMEREAAEHIERNLRKAKEDAPLKAKVKNHSVEESELGQTSSKGLAEGKIMLKVSLI